MSIIQINSYLIFIIASIFSYFFVYLIPWNDFIYFVDNDFYLDRINLLLLQGFETETTRESSGIFLLTSEILWFYILSQIPFYFINPEDALLLISFFSLLVYTFYTFKNTNILLSSILLFNPIFIDLIMGQMRVALAFVILLIVYNIFEKSKLLSIILIFSAALIHTATFIFIAIFYLIQLCKYFINSYKKLYLSLLFIPFIIVLFMTSFLLPLLEFFGDSRTLYFDGDGPQSSILFSFVYLGFSILIAILPKSEDSKDFSDIISFSIFVGSLFFGLSIVGLYGSRFIAVSFPFFIIAIDKLRFQYKTICFSLLFVYQLIYINFWLTY